MKYAVIGSRQYPTHKQRLVGEFVRSLPADAVVGSGRASGVDTLAETAALARELRFVGFPVDVIGLPDDPEERRIAFAKRAFARNCALIAWADEVIAFWTWCVISNCRRRARMGPHKTHGTHHSITEARRTGKPLRLFGPDGRAEGELEPGRVVA